MMMIVNRLDYLSSTLQEPGLHLFGGGSGDQPSHHKFLPYVGTTRGQQAEHREPHQLKLARGEVGVRDRGIRGAGTELHHPRSREYVASLCLQQVDLGAARWPS